MDKFHADAELAPRDVVARATDFEMKRLALIVFIWILAIGHLILLLSIFPRYIATA